MEKRVLTVLRSGGEYGPEHVQAIQRQLAKWAPSAVLTCLSDVDIPGVERIPLKHDWPGWWAKLELFGWDMPDDFLYTDLDNVIFGPIDELLATEQFTADIGFSFFRMTSDVVFREGAYETFRANPAEHMSEWDPATRRDGKFGDAAFLRWCCGLDPQKWSSRTVMNIVDMPFDGGRLSCPWRVTPRIVPDGVSVMLCGGKRRRPWLSISQEIQRAYWCREK